MINKGKQRPLHQEVARLRKETAILRELLTRQDAQIARLEQALTRISESTSASNLKTETNTPSLLPLKTSRRRLLQKLAASSLAVAGMSAVLSSPTPVQARIVTKNSPNLGTIIVCGNTTVSGSVPATGKYSLIATSEVGLNLSTLPVSAIANTTTQIGVYGYAAGGANLEAYGVYGKSNAGSGVYAESNSASGLYAQSNTGNGVYALTNSGNAVYGQSKSGTGVAGYSDTSNGVYGQSSSGTAISGSSNSGSGVYGQSSSNNGVYGSSDSGNGLNGQSNSNYGVAAVSKTSNGVYAQSDSGSAVKALSKTGVGVEASSDNNYGVSAFSLSNSQLRLIPRENNVIGPPSTGLHYKGELWLDDTGSLFVCISQGTPGSWQKFTTTSA